MTVYHIYDISWDLTWDDVVELRDTNLVPSEMYLSAEDIGVIDINGALDTSELENILSDAISDITGYCHYGFQYEIIKEVNV